jgi:phosphopantothenoylcysteine decarboxylase
MKLVLGITGSVATVLTPKLVKKLQESGHEVKIVATTPAIYFLDENMILGSDRGIYFSPDHNIESGVEFFRDKDEWPTGGYHKNDPVRHIEFRTWADMLLIAPLSANTLAKLVYGNCDNFLTCIARAWPKAKPLVVAPAMNTEMWIDSITSEQLRSLRSRFDCLTIIDPIEKQLACGDVGKGAMAEINTIVEVLSKLA